MATSLSLTWLLLVHCCDGVMVATFFAAVRDVVNSFSPENFLSVEMGFVKAAWHICQCRQTCQVFVTGSNYYLDDYGVACRVVALTPNLEAAPCLFHSPVHDSPSFIRGQDVFFGSP